MLCKNKQKTIYFIVPLRFVPYHHILNVSPLFLLDITLVCVRVYSSLLPAYNTLLVFFGSSTTPC